MVILIKNIKDVMIYIDVINHMDSGRWECEIKNWIEIARSTFIKMRDVLISRKLHLEIRKRLVRCYVLSTFLYASESWTLDRQIEDKINAFEMWIFRRMFRISHLDRKTDLEVLEMAKAKQTLLRTIQERKLHYFWFLFLYSPQRCLFSRSHF